LEEWRNLRRIIGLLEGSEQVVEETFAAVERECRVYESKLGKSIMSEVIEGWGDEVLLLRGNY
jgi:hypothetical protein